MRKRLAVVPLLGAFFVAGIVSAGEPTGLQTNAAGDPLVSTFSIVALDPATGDLGIAVQSKFPNVRAVVPWARAGVGAVQPGDARVNTPVTFLWPQFLWLMLALPLLVLLYLWLLRRKKKLALRYANLSIVK